MEILTAVKALNVAHDDPTLVHLYEPAIQQIRALQSKNAVGLGDTVYALCINDGDGYGRVAVVVDSSVVDELGIGADPTGQDVRVHGPLRVISRVSVSSARTALHEEQQRRDTAIKVARLKDLQTAARGGSLREGGMPHVDPTVVELLRTLNGGHD